MSTPRKPKRTSAAGTVNAAQANPPRSRIEILGLAALALLGILVLFVALWVARVQIKWLLLRARLRRGTRAEQVAGAWHWLRLRWAQSGYFDYVNLTPDRISHLAAAQGDPVLEDLAGTATEALYARQPELNATQVEQAWQNAKTLRARAAGNWSHRLRSWMITPSAANRRESAHRINLTGKAVEHRTVQ